MGRTHAARRLGSASVINNDPILAPVHRQTVPVGRALFGVFDVRRIAFQHRDLVDVRVLTPISRAALAGLDYDDVVLRDGALDLVAVLLQVDIGDT